MNEYHKFLRELCFDHWSQLSVEEKKEKLIKLEGFMARFQGRDACPIDFDTLKSENDDYGDYNDMDRKIYINIKLLEDNNEYVRAIFTVIHEGTHALQDHIVNNYKKYQDFPWFESLRKNLKAYLRYKDYDYYMQFVERHADYNALRELRKIHKFFKKSGLNSKGFDKFIKFKKTLMSHNREEAIKVYGHIRHVQKKVDMKFDLINELEHVIPQKEIIKIFDEEIEKYIHECYIKRQNISVQDFDSYLAELAKKANMTPQKYLDHKIDQLKRKARRGLQNRKFKGIFSKALENIKRPGQKQPDLVKNKQQKTDPLSKTRGKRNMIEEKKLKKSVENKMKEHFYQKRAKRNLIEEREKQRNKRNKPYRLVRNRNLRSRNQTRVNPAEKSRKRNMIEERMKTRLQRPSFPKIKAGKKFVLKAGRSALNRSRQVAAKTAAKTAARTGRLVLKSGKRVVVTGGKLAMKAGKTVAKTAGKTIAKSIRLLR